MEDCLMTPHCLQALSDPACPHGMCVRSKLASREPYQDDLIFGRGIKSQERISTRAVHDLSEHNRVRHASGFAEARTALAM